MDTKKIKDRVEDMWPKTKQELEKAISNARDLLNKGEASLKVFSEKGMASMKQLALSLKKEQLCFDLGKTIAATPPAQWKASKKISGFLNDIKKVDGEIKRLKKVVR